MTKFFFPLIICALISLSSSCDQKIKEDGQSLKDNKQDSVLVAESPSELKMYEIDSAMPSFQEVKTLRWEKTKDDNSEFIEVTAYLNEKGYPSKIVEYFYGGNFKDQGERNYYFEDNVLIAVTERVDKWADSSTNFFQVTQTFYEDGKATFSRARTAQYEENIEKEAWKKAPVTSHVDHLETVNQVLSGEGRFQTNFISVIQGPNSIFLLLGEPKEDDRYVTTVRVDELTPFVKDLLDNMRKYRFRPLRIQFKVVGGKGQPEFRVLTDAEWIE
ncbi:MAG: hypothetical protein R3277_13550 [Brumimicrobium sp.]|nr:hypothetical protein [Brumimicrobium sp.]